MRTLLTLTLLLLAAGVARADADPPTEVGVLHCDGKKHEWTIDVAPGEHTFEWHGDRACEGAEARVKPGEPAVENHSVYDGGSGVLRLRVKNPGAKPLHLHLTTFAAYA